MFMADSGIAIILVILILLIGVSFRKYLNKLNLLSFFFYMTIVFNFLTLIIWGFDRDYFITAFPSFKLYQITTTSFLKASIIILGGLIIVILSYILADLSAYKGQLKFRSLFGTSPKDVSPYIIKRILIVSIAVAVIQSILIITNADQIIEGFILGIMGGDHSVIMDARQELNSSYIFFLWSINILPFTCISLYALYRVVGKYKVYARLYILLTVASILCTFFKGHLIIFIALLLLAKLYTDKTSMLANSQLLTLKNVQHIGLLFVFIISLYALFGIAREESSILNIVLSLGETASSRIIGRLGISILMYGHYFPEAADHYGFANLNIFSKIFDYAAYLDTKEVFRYFSIQEDGSVAINATMDFYAAFGWPGWILGCMILGFGINLLDKKIILLDNNLPNFVIKLYSLVFVYYLTQASVFRAALGYGGLFFVAMWLAMRITIRQKKKLAQSKDSLTPV